MNLVPTTFAIKIAYQKYERTSLGSAGVQNDKYLGRVDNDYVSLPVQTASVSVSLDAVYSDEKLENMR